MAKRKGFAGLLFLFVFLAFIAIAGYLLFQDMDNPDVTITPDHGRASPNIAFTVTAQDQSSGIKSITVAVRKDSRFTQIAKQTFEGGEKRQEIKFKITVPDLLDSSFELEIRAADNSLAGFGRGNTATKIIPLIMDMTPPRIRILTSIPYIRQGGTGCILFASDKKISESAVEVGEYKFPCYTQPNEDYLCLFAFPYNVTSESFTPVLVAKDSVENEARVNIPVNRIKQTFKHDSINVSEKSILEKMTEFSQIAPGITDPLKLFLKINSDIRKENSETLMEFGKNTTPLMRWQGSFIRLPKGAPRAGFADHRTYMYTGAKVDEQTHLGLDLASTQNADVPATNNGTVIFTGYMGIFGNMIVIDHGAGLQSLYAHLSEILCIKGQEIKRGEIIAKTGTTGMSWGDHLHFGITISGVQVSPIEWLDDHWIQDNVIDRITKAGGIAPSLLVPAQVN